MISWQIQAKTVRYLLLVEIEEEIAPVQLELD
uniref:Uncharacterized protein n=1 Tax=Arundo donax TaxID=35708 RepID=A0A0A9H185_ARUDO